MRSSLSDRPQSFVDVGLSTCLGFKSESIKLQITLLEADLQNKTDLNSGSHSLRMHTNRQSV